MEDSWYGYIHIDCDKGDPYMNVKTEYKNMNFTDMINIVAAMFKALEAELDIILPVTILAMKELFERDECSCDNCVERRNQGLKIEFDLNGMIRQIKQMLDEKLEGN